MLQATIDFARAADTDALIMELIQHKGGEAAYSDPHVPVFPPMPVPL